MPDVLAPRRRQAPPQVSSLPLRIVDRALLVDVHWYVSPFVRCIRPRGRPRCQLEVCPPASCQGPRARRSLTPPARISQGARLHILCVAAASSALILAPRTCSPHARAHLRPVSMLIYNLAACSHAHRHSTRNTTQTGGTSTHHSPPCARARNLPTQPHRKHSVDHSNSDLRPRSPSWPSNVGPRTCNI